MLLTFIFWIVSTFSWENCTWGVHFLHTRLHNSQPFRLDFSCYFQLKIVKIRSKIEPQIWELELACWIGIADFSFSRCMAKFSPEKRKFGTKWRFIYDRSSSCRSNINKDLCMHEKLSRSRKSFSGPLPILPWQRL